MGKVKIIKKGEKFGRLTVLRQDKNNKHGDACWVCTCECGKNHTVAGGCLRNGSSRSCGCLFIDSLIKRNKLWRPSVEIRKKLSEECSIRFKGKKLSVEQRETRRQNNLGAKSHFWKGGISPLNKIIRGSLEYTLWRETVFVRDDYTCQECGKRGGKLHADHIKAFATYPELRLTVTNGRALCIPCHKLTDNYAGRTR